MGETLPIFSTTFNRSAQIEARADHLSADTGALLLREIMERTGIIEWMTERLLDPRNPHLITYPLADLLRTSLLMLGQGWRDQDDADRLRHDPSLRVANDSRRGTGALEQESVLPSQPTLSRLLDVLSGQTNQEVLREAVIEQALRRLVDPTLESPRSLNSANSSTPARISRADRTNTSPQPTSASLGRLSSSSGRLTSIRCVARPLTASRPVRRTNGAMASVR